MRIEPGATKRLVIMLWCLSVSAFLYYFSVSMKPEISLLQFLNFTALLFGGGVAYHVTTELLACPQTGGNYKLWRSMLIELAKVYVGYIIAGVSLFAGMKFGGDWGWLLALLGLIFGYLWVMHYIFKLEIPIKALFSTQPSVETG